MGRKYCPPFSPPGSSHFLPKAPCIDPFTEDNFHWDLTFYPLALGFLLHLSDAHPLCPPSGKSLAGSCPPPTPPTEVFISLASAAVLGWSDGLRQCPRSGTHGGDGSQTPLVLGPLEAELAARIQVKTRGPRVRQREMRVGKLQGQLGQ